ncbi:D-alanine--D-alanine ligase family protein [Protofrankia symbiont of Coriaria ruscifolia]|uniref:D-alanine--D-alanine ligase n=1 Tax=Candidatus Protofrankia californiensis TaxID=1839754 RepID=A0A1C3PD38_9ACTN|nr:D-alanine--D-alanine ligase family protein [Protofrankia symbiont of Coriaria ruscifolia]SBW27743.1 D-alanine-D-alanine ligase [Candidatus Protofrankia californiensis]
MPGSPRRIRIAVLYGGRSTEHAISCVSAGSVLRALDRQRYDVVAVGITPDGRWVLGSDDPSALAVRDDVLPAVDAAARPVALPGDPTAGGLIALDPAASGQGLDTVDLGDVDVVFPLLHGPFGEDGTVQGLLEMAAVPYVGSGVFASAAAMDKQHMKTLLTAAGLDVGPYVVLRAGQTLMAGERERLGLPVFVKPARGGSSIGISRVDAWDDLATALKAARAADPKVLVEAAVVGREIECGVLESLDGREPEASLPAEVTVTSSAGFYDFEAKYLSDAVRFDIPANLSEEVTAAVREIAVRAFDALDCAGLARVDVFVRPDGSIVVNEVNTMPGFTPTSMFPQMWGATGLEYPRLVDRLVALAIRRGTGLR